MTTKTAPAAASSRSAWLMVESKESRETPATAIQPGWPASGAAVIRMLSSSTAWLTEIRPCWAWRSSPAVTSGTVPVSGLAPRTRPVASMTCTRYSPGVALTGEAAVPDGLPADRYRPAWLSGMASWESIALSCADESPLINSQLPRANTAAAATANAIASRNRIGMPLSGLSLAKPVTHAPDRLEVVPPERRVDLPPQVVHVL